MNRFRAFILIAAAAILAIPGRSHAVILHDNYDRNTTVTPDSIAYDAWNLQGNWTGFLGTPISSHHFITAAHVGGGPDTPFYYRGQIYTIDRTHGTNGVITSPDHDLAIWKVNEPLPAYAALYDRDDEVGKHLVVVGRGAQRGDNVFLGSELKGWLWGQQDGVQSWGENDVASIVNGGAGAGQLLRFTFDRNKGPNEAHLSAGDSGGGLFILDGGVWKLAGINYGTDGPFAYADGAPTSAATLFDKGGLYEYQNGDYLFHRDMMIDKPTAAYATRISSNLGFITTTLSIDADVTIGLPEPTTTLLLLAPLTLLRRPRRGSTGV